jgi:hypothetical protein
VVLGLLAPLAVATVVGMVLLWPAGDPPRVPSGQLVTATIVATQACPDLPPDQCKQARVEITSGPDAGETFVAGAPVGVGAPQVAVGDRVVLQSNLDAPPDQRYVVADFQRS